jgi:hypothetical protein
MNKEINRHLRALSYENSSLEDYKESLPFVQRILNSNHSDRLKISAADLLFSKVVVIYLHIRYLVLCTILQRRILIHSRRELRLFSMSLTTTDQLCIRRGKVQRNEMYKMRETRYIKFNYVIAIYLQIAGGHHRLTIVLVLN